MPLFMRGGWDPRLRGRTKYMVAFDCFSSQGEQKLRPDPSGRVSKQPQASQYFSSTRWLEAG